MLTRGSCIGYWSPWLLESHLQGACLSFAWATLFFSVSIHKSMRHGQLYSSLSLFSHEMWSLSNSVLIFILTWSVKCEQLWSTVWCSLQTPSIPILMALRIRRILWFRCDRMQKYSSPSNALPEGNPPINPKSQGRYKNKLCKEKYSDSDAGGSQSSCNLHFSEGKYVEHL